MSLLRRRLLRLAPLSAFALSGSALWVLVEHLHERPEEDEPEVNPLVGAPLPQFAVPALGNGQALATQDFAHADGPVLLNFFASWCAPCVSEMPVLLGLRQQGVTIWGIAYRDQPEATAAFLRRHGDPYQRVGRDDAGSMGPTFNLAGVPESFLISRPGVVRWSWAGGLSQDVAGQSLASVLKAVS